MFTEKRMYESDASQQTGCTEPRDCVSVGIRVSLARGLSARTLAGIVGMLVSPLPLLLPIVFVV
jgi:hypothetical protein